MSDIPIDKLLCKLKQIRGISHLFYKATLLYVLLLDADLSTKTKTIIIAALLYLIDPLDAVPDLSPVIGFLDDLAVIAAALRVISAQVRPHHENQAYSLTKEL